MSYVFWVNLCMICARRGPSVRLRTGSRRGRHVFLDRWWGGSRSALVGLFGRPLQFPLTPWAGDTREGRGRPVDRVRRLGRAPRRTCSRQAASVKSERSFRWRERARRCSSSKLHFVAVIGCWALERRRDPPSLLIPLSKLHFCNYEMAFRNTNFQFCKIMVKQWTSLFTYSVLKFCVRWFHILKTRKDSGERRR